MRAAGPDIVGDCGLVDVDSYRVLGGHEASLGQIPWQVRIEIKLDEEGNSDLCGGTIIDNQWIISASHCVELPYDTTSTSSFSL